MTVLDAKEGYTPPLLCTTDIKMSICSNARVFGPHSIALRGELVICNWYSELDSLTKIGVFSVADGSFGQNLVSATISDC